MTPSTCRYVVMSISRYNVISLSRYNDIIYTMMQHIAATGNSPNRSQAATMPASSATMPGNGVGVVSIMSGNVITVSVTYGT